MNDASTIPISRLEPTKQVLRNLIDERSSAPWASYSDEDQEKDKQDCEDIETIKTVLDVLRFLRDQAGRSVLVEYASCLDPLNGFKVEGKECPDEEDEESFRKYLMDTYGIPKGEFYR